jgi:hypothetical protein
VSVPVAVLFVLMDGADVVGEYSNAEEALAALDAAAAADPSVREDCGVVGLDSEGQPVAEITRDPWWTGPFAWKPLRTSIAERSGRKP